MSFEEWIASADKYLSFLSRHMELLPVWHKCFTGKDTTLKFHAKLHLGPEWHIFRILTGENIDEVVSRLFTGVSETASKEREREREKLVYTKTKENYMVPPSYFR